MRKTIAEIAEVVVGGQIITRLIDHDQDGKPEDEKIGTIVAKSIKDGFLSKDNGNMLYNAYKEAPDERKLTHEGDIVIKLTQPFSACLIGKDDCGLLVSSFCAIIRGNKSVVPEYLVAYLNSYKGVRQVTSMMAGSTISTISLKNVGALSIPIPSVGKQKEIGKAYENRIKAIQLADRLKELEEEKLNAMIAEVDE
jgi:restriction endonuclease S subunit